MVRHRELRVVIHLCLMAPPGASLANPRVIRSHPMPLGQCRTFVLVMDGLSEPHADTAGARRATWQQQGDRTIGAVA
ncbi:MAG: hypothetical protein IPP90_05970 [Gemmatimonadaceae bacterium]|nr:hypothetical protein [Gemmatimonadaceae bacterium]